MASEFDGYLCIDGDNEQAHVDLASVDAIVFRRSLQPDETGEYHLREHWSVSLSVNGTMITGHVQIDNIADVIGMWKRVRNAS